MSTTTTLHDTLRDLLAAGMGGLDTANAALRDSTDKRKSAYTMFVDAALASDGNPEALTEVADTLFAEIRVSATVSDTHGNTYSVTCKPGKEGQGFLIPSSFSAARTYTVEAIKRGVALRDDEGAPRTYSQIRKDVMAQQEQERREQAKGDDALRYDCADMIAALSAALEVADSAGLADMYKRLRKATAGMGESKAPEAQAEVLAAAA